jgi:hypothetical protein
MEYKQLNEEFRLLICSVLVLILTIIAPKDHIEGGLLRSSLRSWVNMVSAIKKIKQGRVE